MSKIDVKNFWENASCGEELYLKGFTLDDYLNQSKNRYFLEPEIIKFGEFEKFKGKSTLEIGVGLGADHQLLFEAGAILTGIDLTERAIFHTKNRFSKQNYISNLIQGDAENLPFQNDSFEMVYSWGVLHHTPNTQKAINEVKRVLKKGGLAKIMIYHKYSIVGLMLWIRYGLFKAQPFISLDKIYDKYLESPGTKAYSRKDLDELFKGFKILSVETPLGHGDLLTSDVGQRHRGFLLDLAKKIWPRRALKFFLPNNGLSMMITCTKI